jgi:hypothetical protein
MTRKSTKILIKLKKKQKILVTSRKLWHGKELERWNKIDMVIFNNMISPCSIGALQRMQPTLIAEPSNPTELNKCIVACEKPLLVRAGCRMASSRYRDCLFPSTATGFPATS